MDKPAGMSQDEYERAYPYSQMHVFRGYRDLPPQPAPRTDLYGRLFPQGRSTILWPFFGASGFVCLSAYWHWHRSIPIFARFWQHVAAGVSGWWLGGVSDAFRSSVFAERDAMMAHYISLHPEDFIEEPAPKLKYVIYPWAPWREGWEPLKDYPLK